MAQNDNNQGMYLGFGIIAAALLFLFVVALFVIEIAAIAFAAFSLLVINWRYKIICSITGLVTMILLTQPLQNLISAIYQEYDIGILVWAYKLAPWGVLSVGFIVACILLDFINDQRNQPTSEADLLAWRIKWGFTKGIDLDRASSPAPIKELNVFDVPPQDGS